MRRLLPASAYSECLVGPIRTGTSDVLHRALADGEIEIAAIDATVARRAAELRAERPSLRLPDALVIATALVHQAELVTLDRRMTEAFEALR